jgi:hypothetical protein
VEGRAAPAKHTRTLTVCVKSGSAKGLWHHGTRIATGSNGTYKTTGWVKASAFCS